jgi:hypothetical protein
MDFLKKLKVAFFGKEKLDDTSPRGAVDLTDYVKMVRNLLLGVVAAGLTYYIEDPEALAQYGPITVVVFKLVFDFVQKLMKENKVDESN